MDAPTPHTAAQAEASTAREQPEGLSLQRNMLFNTVGSLAMLAARWLLTVVVVRLSSDFDAAGTLSLAMTVTNLVTPFAEFRMRTVQVTDVNAEHSTGEYLGLRVLTCAGAFAGGSIYAALTCPSATVPVVMGWLFYACISYYMEGYHGMEQRIKRMDCLGISYMLQGAAVLGAFSAGLALSNNLLVAVLCVDVAELAVFLLYDLPTARRFDTVRPVVSLQVAREVLLHLLPLVLASVCSSAVLALPRQYLAASAGEAVLGAYSSVAAPAVILQYGASFIYTPLIGVFAERAAADKREALRMFARVTAGIAGIGIACSVGFWLFGDFALHLVFGEKISGYEYLLQPALLCTFVTAFAWFMNDLLIALRDFRGAFAGNAVSIVVMFVLMHPMIDALGANGVSYLGALAYGASVAALGLLLARDYRRL